MGRICPNCGLPKELCECQSLLKQESMTIKIFLEEQRKRYKYLTVIDGLAELGREEMQRIAKKLKSKLACGGTVKDGKIKLQGDHRKSVVKYLLEEGFSKEQIVVL